MTRLTETSSTATRFRDAIPIFVMYYRQHVIIDTGDGGAFTVMISTPSCQAKPWGESFPFREGDGSI